MPAHVKRFRSILKKDGRLLTCKVAADCLEHVRNGYAVYSAVSVTCS